jgi:apurinic endonuclease (APN1)
VKGVKAMFYIGCHLSASDGFLAMGRTALSIGANTFQFFTRNPRGSKAKAIDPADVAAFLALAAENGFGTLVAHAPYTINPCSKDEHTREFARMTLADDLKRMEHLPGNVYNFHPGSHTGQGIETGIAQIAETLNAILTPDIRTTVLLETMSGKGSEVGSRFEELREIIDRVALSDKLGVCLDTCHVSDAGYDIADDLDGVLTEFDRVIGLDRLRAVHVNDSLNPRGSRKDRHARIGEGCLGAEALGRVVRHPALQGLPFVLETPNELAGYAREIALLKELREG